MTILEIAQQLLEQLSPANQEVVTMLIRQLAEKDGVKTDFDGHYLADLCEGFDLWTSELELRGMVKTTIDAYRQRVERLLAQYPAPVEMDIKKYLSDRQRDKAEKFSKGTIAGYIKAFRSFFDYLYANGLVGVNPVVRLKQPHEGKYHTRRIPPEEDVRKLVAQNLSLHDLLFLMLLIDGGLRVSELAEIERSYIDFEEERITVIGKGSKERNIFLSKATFAVLSAYTEALPRTRYLFPAETTHGEIISDRHEHRRTFNRRLEELCEAAAIEHLSPHQLRHFAATYLITHGGDIKAVSEFLGHANVNITLLIYHHVTEQSIRRMHEEHSPFAGKRPLLPSRPMLTNGRHETVEGEFEEVEDSK